MVTSPVHHHTHTYPGAATGSPIGPTTVITPGAPMVPVERITETPTVHHIHHLPGNRPRTPKHRTRDVSDSDESDSEEEYTVQRSRR